METSGFNELLAYISNGCDIAIFAIVYFIWKLHERLREVEILIRQYMTEVDDG